MREGWSGDWSMVVVDSVPVVVALTGNCPYSRALSKRKRSALKLSIFVIVLQSKKQIRYKRQIRDTLHAYIKRYIVTK